MFYNQEIICFIIKIVPRYLFNDIVNFFSFPRFPQQAEDDFLTIRVTESTIVDKNNETNDKFYRKVAFLMYTEMVNFKASKRKERSSFETKTKPRTGH